MLTHRLMSEGRAAGAYWGMPTQATASAMYTRQEGMLAELFETGAQPSLVLMHGQARLHERFQSGSPLSAGPGEATEGALPSDETATAACAAFLAEDRRAALLADIGAGTIDQALLAALPSRFHTVRLFGLADKVLVVDEAHAYDAYMGAEIEGLLRFQAALGGCAIVLSATLPNADRERFVRAWCEGLGERPARRALTGREDYPLITMASSSGVNELPVEAAPSSRRTTPVRFVEDPSAILSALEAAARKGAAVAWVRNTVDDAIAAADDLRARGLQPLLFHARFAQGDRQRIERDVMALLGKDASAERRRGAIVVATQVIEQSLDLDVDLMASDLAPVDLLIQRAGRLRRHRARDAERPSVDDALLVLSPRDTDDPRADWLSGSFARASEWIYKDPAILWRTRRVLGTACEIAAPDMIRTLIEAVYAPDTEAPEGLRSISDRADGQARAERSLGQTAIASLSEGYVGEAREWMSEERARTRLGDAETTLRLARVLSDGSLGPFIVHDEPRRAWALSEVRVRAYRAPPGAKPLPHFQAPAERARAAWGRREQQRADLIVLQLEKDGEGLVGRLTGDGRDHIYRYLGDRGLTFG